MKYKIKNISKYKLEDLDLFYNIIYKKKKKRINKYVVEKKKISSIIGDSLLSDLLSEDKILYKNLKFIENENGKPYIKNLNYFFNISHSFDYVITVFSKKEIGVDIEKIRKTNINIIKQFATENEQQYILSNKNNIYKRIFQIYTLKEAYFKMKGDNLNNILKVEFIIKNNKIYCSDKKVKAGFIKEIKGYIISYCEKI